MDTQNTNVQEQAFEEDEVEELTATPLWRYVTKVSSEATSSKGGGGSGKFICNFGCRSEPYTGSYSRVRAHLIGTLPGQRAQGIQLCTKLSKTERELLKQEEMDAKRVFGGNSKARKLPLPISMSQGSFHPTTPSNVSSSIKSTIDNMFHVSSKEEVDQKIGRCLYGNGIPFHVVRSPLWADMVAAINNAPKGYKSPNYEKIRTTLLDKEQSKVKQALSPLMEDWNTHGVSIISNGWSNLKNQPLINIMTVSGGKAMFVNGHDVSSMEKNAPNIAELLSKAIDYVGPSNVVQVVTDNASNCKAAGAIIEHKHPHIFWSGCLAHTLNLLMKDIAESGHPSLSFVGETYKRGKAVVKYIKNHSACQFLFRTFSSLELLKAKKTRFAHNYIVLQRLVRVRAALVSMALSKQWESIRRSSSPEQHDIVHQTIMDDDFWRRSERVLKITTPIYKMIRFSDSDKAVIGEVYEQMDTMLGYIKDILFNDEVVYELIHNLVVARWDKMNIPLHCLAYVLVPRYYTNAWLEKPAPGGVRRRKPHFDSEVQRGYLEAVDKMICEPTEAALIRQQISDFVSNKGIFALPQAVSERATTSVLSWWHLYGGATPELYSLALEVLSQSVNTSCAKRCWSTYSYIHNVKRNRLNADRAEKLVFVHYNHRLLLRYREDYETTYKNWDAYLEDDIMTVEARDGALNSNTEDDDAPSNSMLSMPSTPVAPLVPPPSPAPSTSTPSCPPPTSQGSSMVQAQRHLQRAQGKRQRQ